MDHLIFVFLYRLKVLQFMRFTNLIVRAQWSINVPLKQLFIHH